MEIGDDPLEHDGGQYRAEGVAPVELDEEAPAEQHGDECDDSERDDHGGELDRQVAPGQVQLECAVESVHCYVPCIRIARIRRR